MQIVSESPSHQLQVEHQLSVIYDGVELSESYESIASRLLQAMKISSCNRDAIDQSALWSENDVMLITYGDSVYQEGQKPLTTLKYFLTEYCQDAISNVHILPFFPYSSDDGFSVIDYSSVNESLGSWEDVTAIAKDYRVMADLVLNHCSARSAWFQNFLRGEGKGCDFFFTAEANADISQVVRPRTSDLLKEVHTANGEKHVWCTFSHDQVDFDFRNPEVLITFAEVIRLYLDKGVRVFRLDAVAFVWKIEGTTSINLEQTHEIVRLLRSLIECACPDAVIITETNVPMAENLSYFGNGNEAHAVYNFSLPPLLLHTLTSGDSKHLTDWVLGMPKTQSGTTYLNFIASHDGIGLRPAEGLLTPDEIDRLVNTMQLFGGKISWRQGEKGIPKAYEINISLVDALSGTLRGQDDYATERFLCAHAIMLSLEGLPAIYIHSLLGTPNDHKRVLHTGQNRSINRHRWEYGELSENLKDPENRQSHIHKKMKALLAIRKQQAAFHPNALQFPLHLGTSLFGISRKSLDGRQEIVCISNVSDWSQELSLCELNLDASQTWIDLISGQQISDVKALIGLQPYETIWLSSVS